MLAAQVAGIVKVKMENDENAAQSGRSKAKSTHTLEREKQRAQLLFESDGKTPRATFRRRLLCRRTVSLAPLSVWR